METLQITATARSWDAGQAPATEDDGYVMGRLEYNVWDPYAVRLNLRTGQSDVTWVFARDLLRDGLGEATGYGDVAVWPDVDASGRLCIRLAAPQGTCVLYVHNIARVGKWVSRTYTLMPDEAQDMTAQVDRALRRLGLGVCDDA